MDRRTLLRGLGGGIVGISGCTESRSSESTTTVSETTTTRELQAKTEEDDCPSSVVSESRRHVHSDYGLGIVAADTERPAVAVVGENWRSELRTDAMSEEDEAFVKETDFQQSVVLVVQYTESSSAHELRLTDYEFDGETLRVELCVVARAGPNDAPTTNIFVRLDHDGSVPSTVEARIKRPMEAVTVSGT